MKGRGLSISSLTNALAVPCTGFSFLLQQGKWQQKLLFNNFPNHTLPLLHHSALPGLDSGGGWHSSVLWITGQHGAEPAGLRAKMAVVSSGMRHHQLSYNISIESLRAEPPESSWGKTKWRQDSSHKISGLRSSLSTKEVGVHWSIVTFSFVILFCFISKSTN